LVIILDNFFKQRTYGNLSKGRIQMKKSVVCYLVLVGVISLFFTFMPNVFSQPESVQVLTYSWYVSPYGDWIGVVGEVQNMGPNIIDYVTLRGVIYTTDELDRAEGYTRVFSEQLLPQQKAPFYIYFFPEDSYTGDFSWFSIGIDHVEFQVLHANQTDSYQYPDLQIISNTPQIDSNGFTVTGSIQNTGNQAAGRLVVVATFYNASGHVIAAGSTNYLTPDSLPPGQTTSFTVAPFDSTSELATRIKNYALLIQTEAPIIPEFSSFLILPLLIVATLVAVIVYRRRLLRKADE
jgi:hypothetical protein